MRIFLGGIVGFAVALLAGGCADQGPEGLGVGCCWHTADCAPDQKCVVGDVGPGFCVPATYDGCYTQAECPEFDGQVCILAELPACGAGGSPVMGLCEITEPTPGTPDATDPGPAGDATNGGPRGDAQTRGPVDN